MPAFWMHFLSTGGNLPKLPQDLEHTCFYPKEGRNLAAVFEALSLSEFRPGQDQKFPYFLTLTMSWANENSFLSVLFFF